MLLSSTKLSAAFLLITLLAVMPTWAAPPELEQEQDDEPLAYQEEGEAHAYAEATGGYRFVSPVGPAARANPYGVNRSGVTAGFSAGLLGPDLKLRADGQFLHPDDYQTELVFDYSGKLRAELESRSLYHNLVRRDLFPSFTSTVPPFATYNAVAANDPASLGIASRQDRAETRIRLGNHPAHLSLGYWRFTQTGYDQLIVADFERLNAVNTFYDVTRRIDQATQEGRVGLDANLGPISLAYTFRIREFNNSAPPIAIAAFPVAVSVPAESRVTSHSIKLYSDLSGGLTATAAYTLTQRENISQRSDQALSGRPQDTIQQAAGDLAYTPFKELTVVLKYRHHEIERETPIIISSAFATPAVNAVRPATDSVKDTLELASAWRPDQQLTLRAEYRADLIRRDNVWLPMTATTTQAVTSDESQLHSGTLSALWRPWRATKLNATYSYVSNNHPTSLNDFNERHVGNLLFDWSSSGRWGVNSHYRATAEQSRISSVTTSAPVTSLVTPRDSLAQSAGVSVWFSPIQKLVLTASYGCMALDANQALLFSPQSASSLTATRYSSLGHVYGLDGVYSFSDQLDLSFGLQQVRSRATYEVPAQLFALAGPPVYPVASTAGIGSYNRLDSTESSASARIDWRFAKHLGLMLDYRFSSYRSDDTQYNGDIHSTTVSLTARW